MAATTESWFSRSVAAALRLLQRESVLFLIIGGINTVLNYCFYLLCLLVFSYTVSFTISYVTGLLVGYCLNSLFVFKEPMRLSSFLRYPIVYVVQYLIGISLLYVIVEILHISPLIAPWIIIVVTIPVTFRLSRYVIRRAANHRAEPKS
jgi:putative flippase GtrA